MSSLEQLTDESGMISDLRSSADNRISQYKQYNQELSVENLRTRSEARRLKDERDTALEMLQEASCCEDEHNASIEELKEVRTQLADLQEKHAALQEEHVSLLTAFCSCVLHDGGTHSEPA